jgi:restriction system protein
MNSICERWVLTCRRELLDRTLIWNQRHLLFEAAIADHRRREAERAQALDTACASHQRVADAARSKAETRNRQVEARRVGFAAGEFEAVEWFVAQVLRASWFPGNFPRSWQVAYRPENRDVVVEFELPTQQVVPGGPVRNFV